MLLKKLIRQLSTLTLKESNVTQKPRRVLVGYGDTEGVPGKNECWNSVTLFTDVIDIGVKDNGVKCKSVEDKTNPSIFHVLHYGHEKYNKNCKHALRNHFMTIEYIQEMYNCDSVLICYWNASHDKRVIQNYVDIPENVYFHDMLNPVRKLTKKQYKSYNLEKICTDLGISVNQPSHSAIGDTLRLQKIVEHFKVDFKEIISCL
jgi:hypothetical protein